MAGRSLRFEPGRRDVALLQIRALVGARRYGEAADRALALIENDPRDVAARTLLRTAVGRLHRSVRAVLTGTPADSTPHVLPPMPASEEAETARHEPFGPFDEKAFAPAREGGTGVRFASGRITSEMPSDEPSVETTADEEPLY